MSSVKRPPRYTVYCHIHIATGRRYIGITRMSMMKRWNRHVYDAVKKSGRGCRHFWAAIRKYGKDAFSHEVLEVHTDLNAANLAEEWFIRLFRTCDPRFGFNLKHGGKHVPHPIKNPWNRPDYRAKLEPVLAKMNDVPFSVKSARSREVNSRPEVLAKQSAATKRQFADPEARAKMSETIAALHQDPETAAKFIQGLQTANANRASKTHCKSGHEFTPENTRVDGNGWRYCKRCAADRVSKKAREEHTHCKNGHEFVDGSFKLSRSGERICLLCVSTHCKRGHEFTPENTYLNGNGSRVCKTCERIRGRKSDARRRAKRKRHPTL